MKQSIKPNIWGPHGWKFMHYVSLGYPSDPTEQDKQNYKNFYTSLQHILPCAKCAHNYSHNLKKYPIDNHLGSRDTLVRWVIDIHNQVNTELNKKEYTYIEALDLYKSSIPDIQTYTFKIIVLLILLGFLYLVIKK
jgi:FAD-linked sulfhydryl oxidase